jgi:ferredoxin
VTPPAERTRRARVAVPVRLDVARCPADVSEALAELAEECNVCYQCGTCASACPSGRDLDRGPRRLVRLILSGEFEALLDSDDLWRCTGCAACTAACRMGVDVASVLAKARTLARDHAHTRSPERSAAEVAARCLERRPRIDSMVFGATMATRGHVPRDVAGAAVAAARLARHKLSGRSPVGGFTPAGTDASAPSLPFYAGCALPQDAELHALVHRVAAGFGIRLDEATDAACCGHPTRGAVGSLFAGDSPVFTACPACDASLAEASVATVPLWSALVESARRDGFALRARSAEFVPYVGCLADRDAALAGLVAAAELAGVDVHVSFPSLHNACCGALGGMYRGATEGSRRLIGFAAARRAPIVTTCVLCRDNVRSAAHRLHLDVATYYWPEFFTADERPGEGAAHA